MSLGFLWSLSGFRKNRSSVTQIFDGFDAALHERSAIQTGCLSMFYDISCKNDMPWATGCIGGAVCL